MTNGIDRPIKAVATSEARADGAEDFARKGGGRDGAFGFTHAQPGRHQRRVQRTPRSITVARH